MAEARQIVYRFDGTDDNNEVIEDLRGEHEIPLQGHIITRREKQWKVVQITKQESITAGGPIPVYRISLTSDLTLPVQVHKR